MGGKDRVDPDLARLVEQRLEDLLAERGPRRTGRASGSAVETRDTLGRRAMGETDRRVAVGGEPDEGVAEQLVAGSDPVSVVRRRPLFTRAHLAVVGVITTLGVLLAGWAVLRARPVPLPVATEAAPRATAATPVSTTRSSPLPSRAASASARASPSGLVVHVLGAVRRPGLVRLAERARVQDAIDQAGGLRAGADLGELNLAQILTDGQQIFIGRAPGPTNAPHSESTTGTSDDGRSGVRGSGESQNSEGGAGEATPHLDLNSATVSQLEALPGVGPVTAAKIIAWREEHGRFTRVEELQEVDGIGPKTYADIAPHCRV